MGAADGKTFDDMNPYTRAVYAYLPAAKREDAKRAIEAAQAAFPGWAATPPSVKCKIFLKTADIMERRQDELVRAMMEEPEGTIGISMFQMFLMFRFTEHEKYVQLCTSLPLRLYTIEPFNSCFPEIIIKLRHSDSL